MYCPVLGCPHSYSERVAGWSSHTSMRDHLNDHCAGRFVGPIPQQYHDEHQLGQCEVCSKLLSRRFGNTCPRCRPQLAQPTTQSGQGRPREAQAPSLEQIFAKRAPTKASVPKDARRLWSRCLLHALPQVVRFNDVAAWADLGMLPKCVLRTQVRGRRESATNSAVETKALCRCWLDGQRTSLWCQGREPTQGRKAKRDKDANAELLQSCVAELVANNQFQKACAAIAEELPAPATQQVLRAMRSKHPDSRAPSNWHSQLGCASHQR